MRVHVYLTGEYPRVVAVAKTGYVGTYWRMGRESLIRLARVCSGRANVGCGMLVAHYNGWSWRG